MSKDPTPDAAMVERVAAAIRAVDGRLTVEQVQAGKSLEEVQAIAALEALGQHSEGDVEWGGWDHRYRRLNEGELIRASDEVQNDDGTWKPAVAVGTAAPNPNYTSHRVYRRTLSPPNSEGTDRERELEEAAKEVVRLARDKATAAGDNGVFIWGDAVRRLEAALLSKQEGSSHGQG